MQCPYEPSFYVFRLQVCPFCKGLRSHLRDHLMRCGLDSHEPERTRALVNELLYDEKERKKRLVQAAFSVRQLKEYYGEQWVGAADALRSVGVIVHDEGVDSNFKTELSFDSFLATQSLQFVRDETHLEVKVASSSNDTSNDLASKRNVYESRGVNTSPWKPEPVGRNSYRVSESLPDNTGVSETDSSVEIADAECASASLQPIDKTDGSTVGSSSQGIPWHCASVTFTLPDDTDAFRESLAKALDALDWDIISDQSKWLEQKYGLGIKSNLAYNTDYYKLFDDFTAAVDGKLQIDLIGALRNMPGMPEIEHRERSLLHLIVAVSKLALPYISDTSGLPCAEESPNVLRRRTVNRPSVFSDESSDDSPPRKRRRDVRTSPRMDSCESGLSPSLKQTANPVKRSPRSPAKLDLNTRSSVHHSQGTAAEAVLLENPDTDLDSVTEQELVHLKLARANISLGLTMMDSLLSKASDTSASSGRLVGYRSEKIASRSTDHQKTSLLRPALKTQIAEYERDEAKADTLAENNPVSNLQRYSISAHINTSENTVSNSERSNPSVLPDKSTARPQHCVIL